MSRAASEFSIAKELSRQFRLQPQAIGLSAGILLAMGLIPGLPHIPFITLSLVVGGIAYLAHQETRRQVQKKEEEAKKAAPPPSAEVAESLLPLYRLELEVGYGLIPLVDEEQHGDLLSRIRSIRRQFASDLGIIIPPLRIRDNLQLRPGEDSQSKVFIVADGAYQRGKIVELKKIADETLQRAATVESVVVVKRTRHEVNIEFGRDMWYHDLMSLPIASNNCDIEIMDAEDPLYLLYTSGTTGKPKAIMHTHGGYMVGTYATLKYVFDIHEEDRFWCAADPGWVTGHSYIVYGPFLNGATSFMYEGAPTYPYPSRSWGMIEKYGINILYTAPTAIRGFMRFGDAWVKRHNLSSLRLLGSVGEPINPEAWRSHKVIGGERCPVMDTWWQTETGMFMITPMPCTPLKPCSGTKPFPGLEVDIVDEEHHGTFVCSKWA